MSAPAIIQEDEGSLKAPDYAFRIGTTRKFFVEAKKPAVDIRYAIHPAYQLRRYAWNAHLPLSILTDFEELAVYDCRTRPDPKDSAATGRVMLFTYEEYVDRWDEIAQIFSKDAVWNGSFDRYAEGSKGKRGTTEVDVEFLKEIEQWRILLARNIALRNFRPSAGSVTASEAKQSQSASETSSVIANEARQSQSASEASSVIASEARQSPSVNPREVKITPNLHRAERQLNYAVQATIDRILFLRICEDRQIEPTDQLLQIAEGSDVYAHLLLLFQKADQKYNSGLFHFSKEKGQTSEPDTFTPTLQIDDKVLRQIIKSTYFPCPYMFNEIPVEILGQVYEQFLGSVIRLTPAGQAKVEEKPEVRKAGGVYYTPRYIVDYIVQNTLGRLLNGDTAIVPVSRPSTGSDRQVSILPSVHGGDAGTIGKTSMAPDRQLSTPQTNDETGVRASLNDDSVIVPVSGPSTELDREVSILPSVHGGDAGTIGKTSTDPDRQVSTPLTKDEAGVRVSLSDDGVIASEAKQSPAKARTDEENTKSALSSSFGDQGGGNAAGVRDSLSNEQGLESSQSEPVRGVPTNASGVGVLRNTGTNASMTPTQALNLRVVDPACGSGSFLLGAYQYLLDWHLNYYLNHDPQSHTRGKNPPLVATEGGEYRLTTETKKRILTASIYGVDIDSQAVEVTKLSLLLKLLEGETGQLTLGFERVLPDLDQNIRCGNSLIGWDYFKGQLLPDEEEIQRVNPFDWQRAFPHVFAAGGFDAVIGNPPYIRIQSIREWAPNDVDHYRRIYRSASIGNFDIYVIFIEKGLSLLNNRGLLGFILPHKFFQASFGAPIREIISQGNHLRKVVHFEAEQVFSNATTYTCLLFLSTQPNDNFEFISIKSLDTIEAVLAAIDTGEPNPNYQTAYLPAPAFGGKEWHFSANNAHVVLEKLRQQPLTLGDITKKIFVGLQTSADKIYVLEKIEERDETVLCYSKSLQKEVEIERGLLKPFLMGKDIHRYEKPVAKNFVIFPYLIENPPTQLMSQSYIKHNYPAGWEYLLQNRKELGARERGRMVGHQFYAYIYPKNLVDFAQPKIMTPEISLGTNMTFDSNGEFYHTTKVYSFVFDPTRREAPEYWLGILNSQVLWYFIKNTGYTLRGGYFTFKTNYLSPFPVPVVDFQDDLSVEKHDRLVVLVKKILELKMMVPVTPQDFSWKSKVEAKLNEEIDSLVLNLYGLGNLC